MLAQVCIQLSPKHELHALCLAALTADGVPPPQTRIRQGFFFCSCSFIVVCSCTEAPDEKEAKDTRARLTFMLVAADNHNGGSVGLLVFTTAADPVVWLAGFQIPRRSRSPTTRRP